MKLPPWTLKDTEQHGNHLFDMSHERQMAMDIVGEIFEDFLYLTGSTVPNAERDENGGDDPENGLAILYGTQYDFLVAEVTKLIRNYLAGLNKGVEIDL